MTDYKRTEQIIIDEMAEVILDSNDHPYLYDFKDGWTKYVTALALHRLANAWERRVEIAEATAKQKGINP